VSFSESEFNAVSHVGIALPNTLVSPLYIRKWRERGRFVCFSKPEFNAPSHVGIALPNTSVSPLSLRERARVRGF
jgi:hypothetical protein